MNWAMHKPVVVCLDLEGVLVPEIWINVASKTGIDDLKITTREMPDYDKLMRQRLNILDQHGLKIGDIQDVIAKMGPLQGATDFLAWLRERCQVIILSDTFYQFALPLMRQLGFPTLFCNQLEIDGSGRIVNYHMEKIVDDSFPKGVTGIDDFVGDVEKFGDVLGDADLTTSPFLPLFGCCDGFVLVFPDLEGNAVHLVPLANE